jgi:hypothetical protein
MFRGGSLVRSRGQAQYARWLWFRLPDWLDSFVEKRVVTAESRRLIGGALACLLQARPDERLFLGGKDEFSNAEPQGQA